jgi:hypothetical protein
VRERKEDEAAVDPRGQERGEEGLVLRSNNDVLVAAAVPSSIPPLLFIHLSLSLCPLLRSALSAPYQPLAVS